MPVASPEVWSVLYTVSRYLFPLMAVGMILLVLFYILSASHARRESAAALPGCGTVGEMIVLSGSRDLEPNTWFPVPREGVLGAVRSCDLVIPCPGVRSKHLDFSWEDGVGLLLRPCTGCEVLVNGMPVTCRTDPFSVPLTHGAVLQVGSAVLRLHLFATLDHTAASVPPAQAPFPPVPPAVQDPAAAPFPMRFDPAQFISAVPPLPPESSGFVPPLPAEGSSPAPAETGPEDSPRRSGRWKEDLGE